jgi:dTDP-4-amino-4,6-dideoxygalactose transaminase
MIYYPIPAHKQKMFAAFGSHTTNLPTTDWLTERVISLPIHTEMDEEQQDYIIETVKMFFANNN